MDAPLQFSRLYKDRRWAPCIEAPILICKSHVPLHWGLDGPDGSPTPRAGATPQQLGIEAAMEPTGVLHGSFYGAPPVFAVVGVAIAPAFVFGPAVAQALDKGRRKRNCEGTRSPNRCMVVVAEHLSGGPEGTIVGTLRGSSVQIARVHKILACPQCLSCVPSLRRDHANIFCNCNG